MPWRFVYRVVDAVDRASTRVCLAPRARTVDVDRLRLAVDLTLELSRWGGVRTRGVGPSAGPPEFVALTDGAVAVDFDDVFLDSQGPAVLLNLIDRVDPGARAVDCLVHGGVAAWLAQPNEAAESTIDPPWLVVDERVDENVLVTAEFTAPLTPLERRSIEERIDSLSTIGMLGGFRELHQRTDQSSLLAPEELAWDSARLECTFTKVMVGGAFFDCLARLLHTSCRHSRGLKTIWLE